MTSQYSVVVNTNASSPIRTGYTFVQGDKGISFRIIVNELDFASTSAKIVFHRANGTSVESAASYAGNVVSYTTLGNEFEVPGIVVADVKFYSGDTQRVSTASFIFNVNEDTLDGLGGGTAGYSDELEVLREQLEEESALFSQTLQEYIDAFGDVGAIHPAGDWNNVTEYHVLDLVWHNGASWLAKLANTNQTPQAGSAYWQQFTSATAEGISYDNDTSGLSATDVQAAIDELAIKANITNPNLLDNPWFTVNQRGFTSGNFSTGTYPADRWKASFGNSPNGTLTLSSGILTLTADSDGASFVNQILENYADLQGKTITASILLADGTIVKATKTNFNPNSNYTFWYDDNGGVAWSAGDHSFTIAVYAGKTFAVRAAKLELGSISTLHLDTVPNYTTELLKCQRYFYRIDCPNSGASVVIGNTTSDTTFYAPLHLSTPMRVLPTVTLSGTFAIGDKMVSAMSIREQSDKQNLVLRATSSGLTAGIASLLYAYSAGYIDFDAEL